MRQSFIILILLAIAIFVVEISFFTLFSQSIRLDESQSIWVSTKPVMSIVQLTGQDVHVPLYGIILHYWLQVFGTTIIAARILSLIFFLLTLPVLFKLYKEASNDIIAILSVLAFSLSPFVLWYSNETRMYTLFTLIATINNLYFLRFIRSEGKIGKFGYFISTVFGLYTHYFFIFSVITQTLFMIGNVIFRGVKRGDFRRTSLLRFTKYKNMFFRFFGIITMAGLCFLPWALYMVKSGLASNMQPLIPQPTSFNIFQTFVSFVFGFQTNLVQSVFISLWPLVVMLFFFIFTRGRRSEARNTEYFVLSAFLPIFLVYIASYIKPIFLSRYLIFTTPSLFFIIIWLCMGFSKRISTAVIATFLLLLLGLLIYQNVSAATPVREDYLSVTNYLNQHADPSDIVTVTAPFTIFPIEYYYTGHARLTTIPVWDRYQQGPIPPFTTKTLQTQLKNYGKQYTDIYIVFSYDQGYEKKIQDYMESHYKRLKLMKFSPGLELREYRLRYDIKTL